MFGYEIRDGITMEETFHGKKSFFTKELELARDFVLESEKPVHPETRCPVCGADDVELFFEKWGLKYYICTQSWTIYAPSILEEAINFEKNSELSKLRRSDAYQTLASESRLGAWKSFLGWMSHRIYRYSPDKPKGRIGLVRGVRYSGLLEQMRACAAFERIDVKGSVLMPDSYEDRPYDTVFCLDTLQRRVEPLAYLRETAALMVSGGLLFLNTRIGSGFDILTLKDQAETVFPYEHIFLPSVTGLRIMLEKAGFKVLEASTPGMFDMAHVYKGRDKLPESDYFSRFLTSNYNERLFADFQKFLQKHGLSSTVRIVAEKQ